MLKCKAKLRWHLPAADGILQVFGVSIHHGLPVNHVHTECKTRWHLCSVRRRVGVLDARQLKQAARVLTRWEACRKVQEGHAGQDIARILHGNEDAPVLEIAQQQDGALPGGTSLTPATALTLP